MGGIAGRVEVVVAEPHVPCDELARRASGRLVERWLEGGEVEAEVALSED